MYLDCCSASERLWGKDCEREQIVEAGPLKRRHMVSGDGEKTGASKNYRTLRGQKGHKFESRSLEPMHRWRRRHVQAPADRDHPVTTRSCVTLSMIYKKKEVLRLMMQ